MRPNPAIMLLLLLLLATESRAEGLANLVSTNRTSGTGVLPTGRVFTATNNPVSFYVGNSDSNAVRVGSADMATTQDVSNAVSAPTLTIVSNSTLAVTNEVSIATIGACTVTLPTVQTGRVVSIVKRDSGTLLTINGGTVEGYADGARITKRFSAEFLCDGVKWWIK